MSLNITSDIIPTKKELGQFFSGKAIASLLACLSRSDEAKDIIDPMSGIGDMLIACNTYSPLTSQSVGVEIDPIVYENAIKKTQGCTTELINGNVFDLNILKKIARHGYDLVITNPPYIRYQEIEKANVDSDSKFNALQVRQNLKASLKYFSYIKKGDKKLLETIINSYSGLSDLAVPSWILCSMLVKEGGRIAMVVPETWLSRNYALIIKYLLLSFFEIEYIIEDGNSSWFNGAQVKTTLVIARRIKKKKSISLWKKERFMYVTLYNTAATSESLVGNIFPNSKSPEEDFFKLLLLEEDSKNSYFESKLIPLKEFALELITHSYKEKWYSVLENKKENVVSETPSLKITSDLKEWYTGTKAEFKSIEDMGVMVSQGLRTGANLFFYLESETETEDAIKLIPNKIYGISPFWVNKKYVKKVIRKQADLNTGYSLRQIDSNGVVLSLQDYALNEDIEYTLACNESFRNVYKPISPDLAHYIREASKTKANSSRDNFIPDLSAVKPNVKKWSEKKENEIPRFWYMLPSFAKRHFPDLFIPRINSQCVKTIINEGEKYLIDANFSSVWTEGRYGHDSYFLLALLNSTLFLTLAEEYGTVMGGGALKLEAIQIKKIALPYFTDKIEVDQLIMLGRLLSQATNEDKNIIEQIDILMIKYIFGTDIGAADKLMELKKIQENLISKRNGK